jgi:hypothetical protein
LEGSDYQAAAGTVTLLPGEITQSLTVQVIGDTQAENDEVFYVQLANAAHAKNRSDRKPHLCSGVNFAQPIALPISAPDRYRVTGHMHSCGNLTAGVR